MIHFLVKKWLYIIVFLVEMVNRVYIYSDARIIIERPYKFGGI